LKAPIKIAKWLIFATARPVSTFCCSVKDRTLLMTSNTSRDLWVNWVITRR
jgi:hypothetical protein